MTNELWQKYCCFYEKPFSEQLECNEESMKRYFDRWKKTHLAKTLHVSETKQLDDVPVTTYSDYPMLDEFGRRISETTKRKTRRKGELFKEYYDRISWDVGRMLDRYMTEPFHLCMKTTGTTGTGKWVVHGETFWRNFASAAMASAVISCSNEWGDTKLRVKDKALNITGPIPYLSGWGTWASHFDLEMIPPIEVTDNLRDLKETFLLLLKAIRKGEKIVLGGGLGSMFYMICKYFVSPEEFYQEAYRQMDLGLKKALLLLRLLLGKLSRKEKKKIVDFMPLKGVLIGGIHSKLYIDFFKDEFGLEPLHAYGSTEAGNVMRGDPDRKTDLVPDLKNNYMEFKSEGGDLKHLDELRKGEIYDLVVTPFGSIFFRYDMGDLFRVIDFRDDGMPIFTFEGRKIEILKLYNHTITPNVIVKALAKAGLRSSDKWAVAKLVKPREHLHFLMEKAWPHSEKEAEKIIFNSLIEADRQTEEHRLSTYVDEFTIKDPAQVVNVEYLRPGAFLRYSMKKAKEGSPIGQYKPPKVISPEKTDIYETLKSV